MRRGGSGAPLLVRGRVVPVRPRPRPHADSPGRAPQPRARGDRRPGRADDAGTAAPAGPDGQPRPQLHPGLCDAAPVRALARLDPERAVHAQPRRHRQRAPDPGLRRVPLSRGPEPRALAQGRGLPHVPGRQVHERLPLRGGRRLRATRLGRLVRAPDRHRGRPLLRLLDERQRNCLALRDEAGRVQRRRRDEESREVHPRLGRAPRAALPLARPRGPAHARDLRRAARRRLPLLARPPRPLLQRGRRERQAVVGAADPPHERGRDRRGRPAPALPPAQPAGGGGHDRGRGPGPRGDRSARADLHRVHLGQRPPDGPAPRGGPQGQRLRGVHRDPPDRARARGARRAHRRVRPQHRPRADPPRAGRRSRPREPRRSVSRALPARNAPRLLAAGRAHREPRCGPVLLPAHAGVDVQPPGHRGVRAVRHARRPVPAQEPLPDGRPRPPRFPAEADGDPPRVPRRLLPH